MSDALEELLRLVAEGRLTPEEAAPLIDALARTPRDADEPRRASESRANYGRTSLAPARLRVRVRDNGRAVVDLQVPGVLAELASSLPGIPLAYAEKVREALRSGARGAIVDVADEDGNGVSITID